MLKIKTKIIKFIAKLFGVKVYVYQYIPYENTIDYGNNEGPNDFQQVTSVPERQIGD